MAQLETGVETGAGKRSKRPIIIGFALMVLGAAGGFFALNRELIPLGPGHIGSSQGEASASEAISFVSLDPMIISLASGRARHLRFSAQLEVGTAQAEEVERLRPRVMDVLNGYLRAVDVAELEDPAAMIRLRAQMLRRIQIVTGEGRVRDLLIVEFVLN